jgi:hypothetical protein
MSSIDKSRARAVADLSEGYVLASVEIGAAPERVFRALASDEIVDWWVRPGVFRTTKWAGDVRVGGRWRASGEVNGQLFALEGEWPNSRLRCHSRPAPERLQGVAEATTPPWRARPVGSALVAGLAVYWRSYLTTRRTRPHSPGCTT